ncbi:MAG: hypothetical protein A3C85_02420 [Candidatus Doudnabacteria bacterium RIFCSPHIGHO2_02_FULL_48_21]|uniref:Galactosyldiacylglycerol synthase n=1 Tax=Candidatus Doudnabacteria bacterium RIFCSPLOWO2_02_FULL_48_13 TaxID=1817845 RepID=A0A1F5QCP5_9BACT|nr:MAG: hypothetical protein A3K05_01475 [Candidatus Doudnabacteria bacterium RIFCSPHIGHO2_01_48_18]OGE79800.1 MAG: hypothetical protein A2668_02230 [Candidatus Doudnabacteria bacterium RIFCSPHIGHO2_01_FULL_48_180]OGE91525.1 MAG: hypothetical protein A3F44_02405 [Candidatus Doudnabacteria bacterium RIFCSPHIGHO2_12_FULL_47_25]OGE93993.1 MAG: hypothetical protein A3C85_02420 [Candidatus Doudnabacteria bacterium RIFCSPHIGHO2_02_FULL_48_21]OGE98033.1 MAG: hypothetical protein A3A83_02655 [Candidatu
MGNKKKILILHTSVGHGIKVTAQNIYAQLLKSGKYEVRIDDIQRVERGTFVAVTEKIYLFIIEKLSFVWGIIYSDQFQTFILPFRKTIAAFKHKHVLKLLETYQPDIVISTQSAPSGIVAYLKAKGKYNGKLVAAFSDYHLHRFWLFEEVDLYLCNIALQAEELRAMGVAEERLAVTGMIISEKYLQKVARSAAAKEFGLSTEAPVVLVSGGRRGLMASKEIVRRLRESEIPFQIAVVTGKNEALKIELEMIDPSLKHPLTVLGYVTDQEILMSAADVLVSKPGGPTIAEAVSKGLPIVITDAHPGHEMRNMHYLEHHSIAWHGRNPMEAVRLVEQILKNEIKHDKIAAYEKIIKPKEAVSLTAALDRLYI